MYQILQEHRGYPLRTTHTPRQNVLRYHAAEDPVAESRKPYTRSEAFRKALTEDCLRHNDRSAHAGLARTEPALVVLEYHHRELGLSACPLLQVRGIRAHAYMTLKAHREAWDLVETSFPLADRCPGCAPDYQRRAGLVLGSWGLEKKGRQRGEWFEKALDHHAAAISAYRQEPHYDHDLYGNGLAHCHLNRGVLHFYATGPNAAIEDAHQGLALIDPTRCETLHGMLLQHLALVLLESERREEREHARGILVERLHQLAGDQEPTVPAMRARWAYGLVLASLGELDESAEHLSDALSDAFALEMPAEVSALCSALAKVSLDIEWVRAEIDVLLACEAGSAPSHLPAWLGEPLRFRLRALYRALASNLAEAATALRWAAAAESGALLLPEPIRLC